VNQVIKRGRSETMQSIQVPDEASILRTEATSKRCMQVSSTVAQSSLRSWDGRFHVTTRASSCTGNPSSRPYRSSL
jgi:hypothetical protein